MNIFQQRIHGLEIKKLKNIKDFYISFEDKDITCILGPNGSGKSTIIHALACCFQPLNAATKDWKFSEFFLPNTDSLWEGSELEITHTYKKTVQEMIKKGNHKTVLQEYNKVKEHYGKSLDRWKPIYKRRPTRDVHYFGVGNCVPLIEAEKSNVKINYSTNQVSDEIFNTILEKASYCLNKQYTAYNTHKRGNGKAFIGVESGGIRYSALSMSAGEQKIFLLLEKVFKAEKYSLILIDELDLLLHDSAINKLIEVISQRAKSYTLQIVFTTHRESILRSSDLINVRHVFDTRLKTLCFNETKPDAIHRLTGTQLKPIEIFVEDDMAVAIVKKVASQLGIDKYVSIRTFGAASNCFTVLAGLILQDQSCNDSIFVLDGDVYKTEDARKKQIKAVLTGTDKNQLLQQYAVEKIKSLNLPDNTSPEEYIHSMIIKLNETNDSEINEIIAVAKEINFLDDNHKYINEIILRFDWDRSVGLFKIINLISSTEEWERYVSDVKNWLISKKDLVKEGNITN